MIHELKTDPEAFDAVAARLKRLELRLNDRDFMPGDQLYLRRTLHTGEAMRNGAPLVFTGEALLVAVLHVLRGPIYGLLEGWVIMSIEHVPNAHACAACDRGDFTLGHSDECRLSQSPGPQVPASSDPTAA